MTKIITIIAPTPATFSIIRAPIVAQVRIHIVMMKQTVIVAVVLVVAGGKWRTHGFKSTVIMTTIPGTPPSPSMEHKGIILNHSHPHTN